MIEQVIEEMKEIFQESPFWIEHTLRVLDNARAIAEGEGLSEELHELVLLVALLHDIGAVEAAHKYDSSSAKYQEAEGPAVARTILEKCGYAPEIVERVCFIVGHHHSPQAIDGIDFQVQWEADLLENMRRMKTHLSHEEMKGRVGTNFKTKTGLHLAQKTLLE